MSAVRTTRLFLTLLGVFVATLAFGQAFRPAAGQTALVLDIQKRGQIVILLHTDKAPKTTAQVIRLAQSGFYNGQKFFKVVKEPRPFLIQTGDPASRTKPMGDSSLGTGGSGTKVPYEDSGFANEPGAVGLSTLPNDRDSGDSQFYILLGPARFLDGSYTVFGKVVSGMDVVRAVELGDLVTSATIVRG